MTFSFMTDARSQKFAEGIAEAMSRLFQISLDEAKGRVNRACTGFVIEGDDDPIYHEDEEHWAHDIYYGHNSMWWLDPPNLTPLPYP